MATETKSLKTSEQPKHRKVRDFVLEHIANQRLRVGDALPAEGVLAESMGVGRNTVRRALADLVCEGFVQRSKGKRVLVARDAESSSKASLGVFGLILPEIRGGIYPSLIRSFEEAAGATGNQMLLCCSNNDVHKQADLILQLIDKRVAGVAILPATRCPPAGHQIRQLQAAGMPVVFLHRGMEAESVAPVIAMSYRGVGALAAQAICEAGHRKVAMFASHVSPSVTEYTAGFRSALELRGISLPDEFVYHGRLYVDEVTEEQHEQNVEQALRQMMELPEENRPTAIFNPGETDACLIYLLLARMGLRVPDDVSIVSYCGVWRPNALSRRLAAVVVDEAQVGCNAVQLLDEMSRKVRPLDDVERSLIPFDFSPGETLAAPKSRARASASSR